MQAYLIRRITSAQDGRHSAASGDWGTVVPMIFDGQAVDSDRARLLSDLISLCAGTAFVVVGMATVGIAAIRRRAGTRIFYWLGIWCAAYGIQEIWRQPVIDVVSPAWLRGINPYIRTALMYLVLPFGSLSWMEATRGVVRKISAVMVPIELGIAALGIGTFAITGNPDRWVTLNSAFAALGLAVLLVVVASPKLFSKYSVLPARGVFAACALVFTLEALYTNAIRPLGYTTPSIFGYVGFAVLIVGFGYAALEMVLKNERRLTAIESELELARGIQASILPTSVPELRGIEMAALYQPMTAVAGDFYEFVERDDEHAGIFVADVCGHGVGAALIASMLKVSVQSAAGCADRPGEFLAAMNRTLAEPLHGQLVSAAYMWLDAKNGTARYSAAGHPPLLRRRNGTVEPLESNGLLFGVLREAEYPEAEIRLEAGDRLLLYTDGITDPEDGQGRTFGEARLPHLIAGETPEGCAQRIAREIEAWQNGSGQQDDRTLLVVDIRALASGV